MTVLETMEEERKGTKDYGAEQEKINKEKIGEANSDYLRLIIYEIIYE